MSTYTPIASQTLSSSQSSVIFYGIPQIYTDLVLVLDCKVSSNDDLYLRYNGDFGSNYSNITLRGNGSTASSTRANNTSGSRISDMGSPTTTNSCTSFINIQNYSNNETFKTLISRSNNASTGLDFMVSLWRNTNAIASVPVYCGGGASLSAGSTFKLYGINSSLSAQAKATGGDSIYRDSSYWYHIFNKSGTLTPYTSISNVDYLVVAGGGSGGTRFGGGGGAGGMITGSGMSLTAQAYTVTVGAGAARQTANSNFGFAGSNSIFNGQTAYGGGLGGGNGGGGNGGSGGGGGQSSGGGTGTSGQGNNGANGSWSGQYSGGGGGGKGSAGSSGTGGSGQASSISGTSVTYAAGGNGSDYYANTQGATGAANTGNGGGGSGGDSNPSGAGGSGIVIVRYPV